MRTLLINYVYYNPVGHVVEALKFSKGLHEANPDIEIHVALNRYSPTQLTEAYPWIAKTYPIDIHEFLTKGPDAACLKRIPRTWDYIMTNTLVLHDLAKTKTSGRDEKAMGNYVRVSGTLFRASSGTGTFFPKIVFPTGLHYRVDAKVELQIPQHTNRFARRYEHDGPTICLLLGGSGPYRVYPTISTWIKIIRALNDSFPNLRIYLTGVRKSEKGRTATSGYTDGRIDKILKTFRNVVDCYDIGLWNQLAIIKQSDVFLSPHTGFGSLAPCVNTPWLTISGGNWPEYFFNHVPFYSVMPDNPDFPYLGNLEARDENGRPRRIPDMQPHKLEKKIPEIIEGTRLLMTKSFTYEAALKRHRLNIQRANVRRDKVHLGPFF
jgi:ADP-heptose:LPS heptosyltransferase